MTTFSWNLALFIEIIFSKIWWITILAAHYFQKWKNWKTIIKKSKASQLLLLHHTDTVSMMKTVHNEITIALSLVNFRSNQRHANAHFLLMYRQYPDHVYSYSSLRKVVQHSTNFHFLQLPRTLTNNKLRSTAWCSW